MNSEIHRHLFVVPSELPTSGTVLEHHAEPTSLEVNVVFATEKQVRSALQIAGNLARSLKARLNLIAVKEVPLGFPLDRPPVAIHFTEQRLYDFASQGWQGPLETTVRLYYCRRKLQGVLQALRRKSLVVMAGHKRPWPTAESRLADALRAEGHEVIFTTEE